MHLHSLSEAHKASYWDDMLRRPVLLQGEEQVMCHWHSHPRDIRVTGVRNTRPRGAKEQLRQQQYQQGAILTKTIF